MFLNFVLAAYLITVGVLVVMARNSIRRFDAVYRIGKGTWEVVVARLFTWTMVGFTVFYWIVPTSIISDGSWMSFLIAVNLVYLWYRMWAGFQRDQMAESRQSETNPTLPESQQSC